MAVFIVKTKIYPTNAELDLGIDSQTLTVPPSQNYDRLAPNFVISGDGKQTYQFLFWHTGRRLTNKRRVKWNFSVGGWGVWEATKWYGIPPTGNGGPPRILVQPFKLQENEVLTSGSTPIDPPPASAFPAGSYPFMGNDRAVGTSSGPVTIFAKDPYLSLEFAGWLRLVWGGDNSGEFVETDAGSPPGSSTFYEHLSGPQTFASGTSADLLATYGNSAGGMSPEIFVLIEDILTSRVPFFDQGDPGPMDRLRLELLRELARRATPGPAGLDPFQRFIEGAARMNREELMRAKQSVQTSLDLGKTALSAIEAQLKRQG